MWSQINGKDEDSTMNEMYWKGRAGEGQSVTSGFRVYIQKGASTYIRAADGDETTQYSMWDFGLEKPKPDQTSSSESVSAVDTVELIQKPETETHASVLVAATTAILASFIF